MQEQQRTELLQSQLASAQASHQQVAAAAASQLAAVQEALSQLEQEASEKLSQADMAAAEAEGQLDELTHDLEEARDAVKVNTASQDGFVICHSPTTYFREACYPGCVVYARPTRLLSTRLQ